MGVGTSLFSTYLLLQTSYFTQIPVSSMHYQNTTLYSVSCMDYAFIYAFFGSRFLFMDAGC